MKGKIYLRPATIDDTKLIFEWANAPDVRHNSFNTDNISWDVHKAWMEGILTNESTLLYILVEDDNHIGQVRLAFKAGKWEISYSIASAFRGHGYGKLILQLAENELIRGNHAGEDLYAEVKMDNIASQRIFKKLGYNEAASQHDNAYAYTKVITKEQKNGIE